jgi:nicotinamide mononucleotide transporter
MSDLQGWLLNNYDEVAGTLIALLYLYFTIKQNIWLWPLGFISSGIYAFVFFRSRVYAGMVLQIYFVIISVYGWYTWWKGKTDISSSIPVQSLYNNRRLALKLFLLACLLFIILSQILVYNTDSDIPYFDAFITALSIVATWMLARKYIEHWLIWLVADSVSVGVYFNKSLYFTVILYTVYTLMALVGYKEWKKDLLVIK